MANRPRSLVRRHAGTGLEAGSGGTLDVDLYELTEKTTPVMADSVGLVDSADDSSAKATLTNVLKILGETAAGANATSALSEVDGVLKINITGTTANTNPATTDKLLIEVTGVNKSVTITNAIKAIGEAMINAAGATGGIAETDGVIKIDIGNVTPTTAPAPADKLLIEVGGVNKSTSITNLVKAVGEAMINAATTTSGISEVNGVVKIDIGTVTATTAPAAADLMLLEVGGINKSASITDLQKAFGEVAAGSSAATGLSESDGVLKVDPTDEALVPGTGYLLTHNAAGEPHKDKAEDIVALMAGDGLKSAAGVLSVDANELTEAVVDVAADSIVILDAGDSSTKRESVADLVSGITGNGLTDSGGVAAVLAEDASLVVGASGVKIKAAALKHVLADGTAAATAVTVAGMAVGDELISVHAQATKAAVATITDRTAEYAIGTGQLTKAAGTDESNNQLDIWYWDRT
jgi:hypothetical protein